MTTIGGTSDSPIVALPATVTISGPGPCVIEVGDSGHRPSGLLQILRGEGAAAPLLRIGPGSAVEIVDNSSAPVQFDEVTLGSRSTLVLNGSANIRSLRSSDIATLVGKPGSGAVARVGSIAGGTVVPSNTTVLPHSYELTIVGLDVEVVALQADGNGFNIDHGCTFSFTPVESDTMLTRPGQSAVLPCINARGAGTLHLGGGLSQLNIGNVKPTATAEYPLTVQVDAKVEVWDITGRAEFRLKGAARLRGNERSGFTLLSLEGGEDSDIQNAALYEFDVRSLPNLARVRRLHPWWSSEGRMKLAVAACRLAGKTPDPARPTVPPYTRNATRWSAIRDILQSTSTRGFDRAISSYLLHDARRIDVHHHRLGAHSFVEELILNVARLFSYGCRLFRPLLVALCTSAVIAGILSTMVYVYEEQLVPKGQGRWEVFLALWADLLFAPISAFRQPDGPTFLTSVVSIFQTEALVLWYVDVAVLAACYGAIVMTFGRHLWRRSTSDPM